MKLEALIIRLGRNYVLAAVACALAVGKSWAGDFDLQFTYQGGNGISLSWPAADTLQTNTALSADGWGDYAGSITSTGGSNSVSLDPSEMNQFFRLRASVAAPVALPATIPGLAYFWNYQDLAPGSTVTNWTDEISGAGLQPGGAPASYVTVLGVEAQNCSALTNMPISLASSNFSVWFVCRPETNIGTELLLGNYQSGRGLCLSSGVIDGRWSADHTAGDPVPVTFTYPSSPFFEIADAAGTLYNNGVAVAGNIAQPTNNFIFSAVGNNASGSQDFQGEIEYIGIWTNYTLTASDVSNLHNWVVTNGVANVTNGLLGWYKLDDGSGTTVADASGNGNDGSLVGTPGWITGAFGDGLSFSGNEQVVATKNFADNLPNFTASVWIKGNWFINGSNSTASRQCQFLGKVGAGGENTGQGWGLFSDNGANVIGFMQDGYGNWFESHRPLINQDGNWHLVTCCYNFTNLDLYLDGVLFTNTVFGIGNDGHGTPIISLSNTNVFIIGGDATDASGWDASCSMDDVRIYNRQLTAAEVLELFRWRGQP
jgi:hypothetical protein